jgi:hypothetical protein
MSQQVIWPAARHLPPATLSQTAVAAASVATLKKILERKNTYLHIVRATCTNTYPESLHLLRDKIKRKKDIFNRKA